MHAQPAIEEMTVPAVATLRPRPTLVCAACKGKGHRGQTERPEVHGEQRLVLTTTHWCPACGGLGLVFER